MPSSPPREVVLRPVHLGDLDAMCLQQADVEANRMAVTNPRDAASFAAHWAAVIRDPTVTARAILADDVLVGEISCFEREGLPFVGYWIAREHWGRGVASRALALLLGEVTIRPLHARVARTNVASLRVLQRCGFAITGYEMSAATERFPACEEVVHVLAVPRAPSPAVGSIPTRITR